MFDQLAPSDQKPKPVKRKLVMGSDESLKGDTFGGLTVAAVVLTADQAEAFKRAGVSDSKKLSESKIMALASYIKEHALTYYVVSLLPEEYNLYDSKGLLNRYHKKVGDECIKQLQKKGINFDEVEVLHIVDKYPGAVAGDIQLTKAELAHVEVAAASILAREAGLAQFTLLSKRAGFTLPLGSTHVQDALWRVIKSHLELKKFAKLHFKNVQAARQMAHTSD